MARRFVLALIGLLSALSLGAQNYKITVKLADSATNEPVGFATVSLIPERGNTKYALTDAEGKTVVEKVRAGKYTLKAELLGYKPYTHELTVRDRDMDLGTLKMDVDQEVLDAASVSATGNPIIIKKDTVEYNASSYKITDDNMLIDLLKKLPGIEVADDGTITSNGKTISRITIAGKTFFLDDPQVATSNLPAKLVEKVKVIKKKSEQAEFTGIDDDNEETIIDLTVQRGMMNGIFGNIVAGGGHDIPSQNNSLNDWRFQANGMVGRFTEDSQLSVIANAGNGPRGVGFNNFSGGMMGGMMGGMGGMGGGMMGGMGGGGITTSWMLGANASMDLLDNRMELAIPYQYQGSSSNSVSDIYKETYVGENNTLISQTLNDNDQNTWGHSISMRMDHKFSDNTSLMIQPQFNFGGGNYVQRSMADTWRNEIGDDSRANDSWSLNSGVNKNLTFSGRGIFRQRLGIPGRTLSLNFNWNIRDNRMDGYNQSLTNTYLMGKAKSDFVNQRIDQVQKSQTLGASLVYTEPLGNYFYMEGRYQVNWSNSLTDKKAFDSGNPYNYSASPDGIRSLFMDYTPAGETENSLYSNNVISRNLNQTIGLSFMYQQDWIRAQLGASAIPTRQYNLTNGKEYDPGTIWNFAPRAMLMYDFNDNANIRINYNGRSGQPSTSQLNPVMDNSNPLSMSLGNPYLTPYFNHNVRMELEYSNRATFFTARFNLNGGMNQNPISNANWYDEGGRQYSFPVNGKNTFNGGGFIMVNAPIAKSNFSISNMINANYSMSSSYIGNGALTMTEFFLDDGNFDYDKFHNYYFEEHPEKWAEQFLANETRTLTLMENFTGTYRSDDVEVRLGFRTNVRKPWYTVQKAVDATWNNAVTGSFMWTVGTTGLSLNTDANYRWYRGYTTNQPSEFIWNASISKTIIGGQATIALQAYDILGQSRMLSVTTTDNYYQETNNRTRLGRYIMLNFTWRFGTFGGGRGRGGFGGRGGRGGRPGAGGPPMGGMGGFGGGMGGRF